MVISASRRTDIPAFYSEWFFKRLDAGHALARNPFNPGQISRVDLRPEAVDCFVFWTKNPGPMLGHLHRLAEYAYYFHFTLNPYGREIEMDLPDKPELIRTFMELSRRIGRERVLWRYDPILIASGISREFHLRQFEFLAGQLGEFTGRCIISFLDLYRKTIRNMAGLELRELPEPEMAELAAGFKRIADRQGLILETCCEPLVAETSGIGSGKCIDRDLIARITGKPFTAAKAKGGRPGCGCAASIDIGTYDTCRHFCRYCYANSRIGAVEERVAGYDPDSPLLCGVAPVELEPFKRGNGGSQLPLFGD